MPECENCGSNVNKGWKYCPKCGSAMETEFSGFSEVFEKMAEELSDVNKMFERQVEAIDLSPWFKKSKGGSQGRGFSIKIVTSGDNEPKVSIQTFGGVDKKQIKKQLYNGLGLEGQDVYEERPVRAKTTTPKTPPPKTTEEPKTSIKNIHNKLAVDLELPGVKKPSDIEIKDLESSIEVKAVVGKKAFFKILTKPENKRITGKSFDRGVLHLEFS